MPRMSAGDTRTLIQQPVERFGVEVPALKQLRVVLKLELPARGADAPVWRVASRRPEGQPEVPEVRVLADLAVGLGRQGEVRVALPAGADDELTDAARAGDAARRLRGEALVHVVVPGEQQIDPGVVEVVVE